MFFWKGIKRRFFGRPTHPDGLEPKPIRADPTPLSIPRASRIGYPTARRDEDHVDIYKSEKDKEVAVHDPYHYLEKEGKETDQFVEDQYNFTQKYFATFKDDVSRLQDELTKNWNYSRFSSPTLVKDGRWYWYYNSGLQSQYVLYRTKEPFAPFPDFDRHGAEGPEPLGEVFFDTNLLTDDGTAALASTAFSKCGKYFAYGVSLSGSDFSTIYVRPTDKPLNKRPEGGILGDNDRLEIDVVRFVKFSSISWTHDSKGFFYQRFPDREGHGAADEDKAGTETTGDRNHMVYYHTLGTDQSNDILVWEDKENPTYLFGVGIAETDGRYLELYISKDTSPKHKLWLADLHAHGLGRDEMKWFKVIDSFDAKYSVIANDERKFYILTDKDATRQKIVTYDLPEEHHEGPLSPIFKDFLPEDEEGRILVDFSPVNSRAFIAKYSYNVKDEVYLVSSTGGRVKRLDPEFVGTMSVSAKRDRDFFFITLSGFNNPGIIKKYRFAQEDADPSDEDTFEEWRETHLTSLAAKEFKTIQVWYTSPDGTSIPMFITSHESVKFNGTAPAIQYGYGGFSYTVNPFFSPAMLTWAKAYKGIIAVPGIRGGAEFGEEWHLKGIKENRPKVYEDFIAAAKFLVDEKYAGPGMVAINGASNGGTLVAACLNKAPEAFGAAVAEVGVMDLLKFYQFTIGAAWVSDYGDPRDPKEFDFIYKYSPLHNIPLASDKKFPPTILLTADHDDRVVPLHSFKHIATIQHAQPYDPKDRRPLLLRVDKKAGHGAGKSTEKAIQEAAEKWGFVSHALGLEWDNKRLAS